MKYLKKFENNKIDYLKYFWLINGDIKEFKITFKKFITENKLPQTHTKYLSSILKGVFFGYSSEGWIFWEIENVDNEIDDIENGKKYLKNLGLEFGGEIKLENNKIVIDDFLKNTDRYNI